MKKQHVIKLMSETTDINKITVTEGRMPQESENVYSRLAFGTKLW